MKVIYQVDRWLILTNLESYIPLARFLLLPDDYGPQFLFLDEPVLLLPNIEITNSIGSHVSFTVVILRFSLYR